MKKTNFNSEKIAIECFGIKLALVKQLVSYDDFNFLMQDGNKQKFVLKISHSEEDFGILKAQNTVFDFLAQEEIAHLFPKTTPSIQGETIIQIEQDGTKHYVRLLTFLEGECLGDVGISKAYMRQVGGYAGQINRSFSQLTIPALQLRDLSWNLTRVIEQADYLPLIPEAENRRVVDYFLLQYQENVMPQLRFLRKSIIHGDMNEYNIIVKDEKIAGFIDFGDIHVAPTINDPAISLAYLLMYSEEPLEMMQAFVEAYHRAFPLEKKELEILYYLVAGRLCQSLLHGANASMLNPENTYISIGKKTAFDFLHRLLSINPLQFKQVALQAAGYEFDFPENYKEELAARYKHISPALSLSYPLKIGRGALQYLYDEQGRTYLDCVNNICHVGHCHPRVVAAAQRQMARLNTNTRYLYGEMAIQLEELPW